MNFDSSYKQESTRDRRGIRWSLFALAILVAAGVAAYFTYENWPAAPGSFRVPRDAEYRYASLSGPADPTVIAPIPDTPWERYRSGSSSRVAILLTDPNSAWLGLAHGLKTIGVPYTITRDPNEAVTHPFVFVYPTVSGKVLNSAQISTLEKYARSGGTLAAFQVVEADLAPFFGFSNAVPSRTRTTLNLNASNHIGATFTDPKEQHVRFADRLDPALNLGSYGYAGAKGAPLATFDDGSAAIIEENVGTGKVFTFGLDLGALILKGYNNREQNIAAAYDNSYQPTLDVFLRMFRMMYQGASADAVTLGTVPDGKRFSVLVAHDVDSQIAIGKCLDYARAENALGIQTTYFIQSKYIRDYNDTAFLTDDAGAMTAQLERLGMEVASHSVSHSRQFAKFITGTGTESYPTYQPFIVDPTHTYNGTIMGELRVSKFILEHFTHRTIVSFRPGNLSNPFTLPEDAMRTGYHYTSATTADDSLTHLPFQLDASRDTKAEVPVFEFPVTVEDEAPPRMDRREPAAEHLAEQIARYGGIVSILIHPNITGYKLDFETRFVKRYKNEAYFSTYRDFGAWWEARNDVTIDTRRVGSDIEVTVTAPKPISGLSLVLPNGKAMVLGPISGTRRIRLAAALPTTYSRAGSRASRAIANRVSTAGSRSSR